MSVRGGWVGLPAQPRMPLNPQPFNVNGGLNDINRAIAPLLPRSFHQRRYVLSCSQMSSNRDVLPTATVGDPRDRARGGPMGHEQEASIDALATLADPVRRS